MPEGGQSVSLQKLMMSTLATVDAVTKLSIEKDVSTEAELKQNVCAWL